MKKGVRESTFKHGGKIIFEVDNEVSLERGFKMKQKFLIVASLLVVALVGGCAHPIGSNLAEKQNSVRRMRDSTLAELYWFNPDLRSKVENAAGVAVFSNLNIHLLLLSTGRGYGIAVDKETGDETYMKMIRIGGGLGAGLKNFRAVIVFDNPDTFKTFIDKGWEFAIDGEMAVIAGGRTGLALGAGTAAQRSGFGAGARAQTGMGSNVGGGHASGGLGMSIYEITKNGIVLQATISGTKYSIDNELNN